MYAQSVHGIINLDAFGSLQAVIIVHPDAVSGDKVRLVAREICAKNECDAKLAGEVDE